MIKNPTQAEWNEWAQVHGLEELYKATKLAWYNACNYEDIDPEAKFIIVPPGQSSVFSPTNPYRDRYERLQRILANTINNQRHGYHNPKQMTDTEAMRTFYRFGRHYVNKGVRSGRKAAGEGVQKLGHFIEGKIRPKEEIKADKNPTELEDRPTGLKDRQYSGFHNAEPTKVRRVEAPIPQGHLIAIGRAVKIEYEPYGASKHVGTRFFHLWGDEGDSKKKSNTLICADENHDIFLIKDDPNLKRPYMSDRGIIG